jgi:hypothetical protein
LADAHRGRAGGRNHRRQFEQAVVDNAEHRLAAAHVLHAIADVDVAQRHDAGHWRLDGELREPRFSGPNLRTGGSDCGLRRFKRGPRIVGSLRRDETVAQQLERAIVLARRARFTDGGLRRGGLERLDGGFGFGCVQPHKRLSGSHRRPFGDEDCGDDSSDFGFHLGGEFRRQRSDDVD